MIEEALRPGFADELLARLERQRRHLARVVVGRNVAAALSASILLAVAVRRRAQ